jgi:hypothetical protein
MSKPYKHTKAWRYNHSETLSERLWSRVVKTGSCWLWQGCVGSHGHGQLMYKTVRYQAHRVAYEEARGTIPEGLVLDHLCRQPRCVRPDHLEPVTNAENVLRGVSQAALNVHKTHCHKGHPLAGANLMHRVRPADGRHFRNCRICHREQGTRTNAKRRAKTLAKRVTEK